MFLSLFTTSFSSLVYTGVAMIGAMPAVYVRHERRKQDKKKKKHPHINLSFYRKKQHNPPSRGGSPCHSRAGSVTPSPTTQSPQQPFPENEDDDIPQEFYVCGRITLLHLVVFSLLIGGIVLIVGLVQLKPGADANANRYYIIGAGVFLLIVGFILIVLRCCILPWRMRRLRQLRKEESGMSAVAVAVNNDAATAPEKTTTTTTTTTTTNEKTDLNGQPLQKETTNNSSVLDKNTVSTDNNPSVSIEMATSLESHDTLQSMKSPSEHDALIKSSTSNHGTSNA